MKFAAHERLYDHGQEKAFDCVEMKNNAQAQLRAEFAGLTDEEERARITRELETSDDIVARKWRRLRRRQDTTAK